MQPFHDVCFAICMHTDEQGRRKRSTRLRYHAIDLSCLEADCDSEHKHLPWGALARWQSIGLRHRGRTYVPETLVQADRSTSFAPCCEDRNSSNPRNFSERYSQTARWQATAGNSRHRAHTRVPADHASQLNTPQNNETVLALAGFSSKPCIIGGSHVPVNAKVLAHRVWNGAALGWAKVGVAWPPSAFRKEALHAVHPS
jgi:hypothetical protein